LIPHRYKIKYLKLILRGITTLLKKIAIGLVLLLVALIGYVTAQPSEFTFSRAALIKAPPERIFSYVNNLHNFTLWSPYEDDSDMKKTFQGNSGVGASYDWNSKGMAGVGRLEVTKSTPSSQVEMKLDLMKPWKCSNNVLFTIEPKGDFNLVTWTMHGQVPFMGKVFRLFAGDKMLKDQFDRGLFKLKSLSERA
jgi:uncharacterized protein YndB with AHSA1/START domain